VGGTESHQDAADQQAREAVREYHCQRATHEEGIREVDRRLAAEAVGESADE
tara:strand:- start:253 stop:408 length:156 start_codon:yes stop_codon:yes gene_type:complete